MSKAVDSTSGVRCALKEGHRSGRGPRTEPLPNKLYPQNTKPWEREQLSKRPFKRGRAVRVWDTRTCHFRKQLLNRKTKVQILTIKKKKKMLFKKKTMWEENKTKENKGMSLQFKQGIVG